ncbi:MAG: phytanoyl-CoA dioxygenase family protein [Gammaproteobacteria bacterium]
MQTDVRAVFDTDGVFFREGIVPLPMLDAMNGVFRERARTVMQALGDRPIGIGSRAGYHELVQRSPGRFDVPFRESDLLPLWGEGGSLSPRVPWRELVHALLGPDARPAFCGVVFSKPGSPAQQWHIDSPHEGPEHRPAHALNVLVALADIPPEAGATELARGSHRLTNHLARPWLVHDELVYQGVSEITPEVLAAPGGDWDPVAARTGTRAMRAGDGVFFDDRILHRGLANGSASERWVAYFSYLRPRPGQEAVADTHFEATRSLFTF